MRWLLLLVALLLPLSGWATDGDRITSGTGTGLSAENVTSERGSFVVERFLLCDGATGGATRTCAVFDLMTQASGMPDKAAFAFETATGCAGAAEVQPIGSETNDLTVTYSLTTSTIVQGGMAIVTDVVNRYLAADITVGTSCTDTEVILLLLYEKKR